MKNQRMLDELTELMRIDVSSGQETEIAEHLVKKLEQMGFAITRDEAGATFGGVCGNILAVREGERDGVVCFCSHMDRVPGGIGIKPVEEDGILRSSGDTILAADDLSGVAGVQVNSLLFTDPINHVVTVSLDESMARFDQLSIRAFDYAGNFSEPVLLENPNYQEPDSATPEPTKTPKPTRKPAATPEPEPTKCPYGLGGSLIYVPDDGNPTAAPTQVPTPEPIIQTEYIPIGPGMPYKADGNSHTLDVLYSAATNKQFITLQSKNGNTFYLVIDYDKPIDEDAEMYETYFLNLVDEKDLLALMSDEEKADLPTLTPEIIYVTPEPTAVPAPTTVPEPQPSSKSDQQTAILALIAMLVLGAAGTFMLFKNKGNGKKNRADNDFLMDDEDDEAES